MSRSAEHVPRLRSAAIPVGAGRWSAVLRAAPLSLRGAAIMPGAALAVHQLRYRLAFGSRSSHELAAQGHAYLASLAPWVVLLAALAIGASLGRLAKTWQHGELGERRRHPTLRIWLTCALALVAIYVAQELLEGLLATGHPVGLRGVFGDGGWWALPAAGLTASLLALAMRGGEALVAALAMPPAPRLGSRAVLLPRRPTAPTSALLNPLARAAAGRAPPAPLATST
jgi:hypothetical protein